MHFKTAVEWLEPRCMLSAQGLTENAHTTVVLENPLGAGIAASGSSSPPSAAYTPTEISNAYAFNQVTFSNGAVQGNGAGQTIALIDAYNDPDIAADLATFDTAFELPAPPSFTVEGQTGTSTLPKNPRVGGNNDWSLEISLDVEWAHALAPDANILLVEANSTSTSNLFTAAATAAQTPGVVAVSMSFGISEFSGETSENSTFTTPSGHLGGAATTGGTEIAGGVTFVSSAGDSGSPGGYPAYSPNVLSVGGTTLNLSAGNYGSETVWDDSSSSRTGGGISKYEAEPAYQDAVVPSSDSNNGANRAMPDVAFDADPNTGVAVVDSFDYGSGTPWVQVGGTSFGAPAWAAIIAIADQGRAINGLGSLYSSSQTLPDIYAMPSNNFHDITSGSNGTYSATVGYDLVTGRGTPIVSSVIGYMDAFTVAATTPAIGSVAYGPVPTSFTVTFSAAYSTSGLAASDFEVNGIAATSYTETSATQITFTFATSPVLSSQSTQTMTIAAGAIIRQSDGTPLTAFTGTFDDDTTPPQVIGAYVSGTPWSQTFLSYLASDGIGSSTLGYLIPAGADQLSDLPWVNINTISVAFNENVSINTADSALQLIGSPDLPAPAALSTATFTYSSVAHTATWTFSSPLATDKYLLSIPSADVADSLGATLDGAWTTSSSTYPSGNGTPGNFNFQFNVLQGDANQDGQVTAQDSTGVRNLLLQNTTANSYSPFYDLVGSGTIAGIDGTCVRINLNDTLPATNPPIPGDGSGDAVRAADLSSASSVPIPAVHQSMHPPQAVTTVPVYPMAGSMQAGSLWVSSLFAPPSAASNAASRVSTNGDELSGRRESLLSQLFEELGESMSGDDIHFERSAVASSADMSPGDTTAAGPAQGSQNASRTIFESLGSDFAGTTIDGSRRASRGGKIVSDSVIGDWSDELLYAISAFGDSSKDAY